MEKPRPRQRKTTDREVDQWVTLLSAKALRSDGRLSVTLGRVVVEAETADAVREKVERKGYFVLEVNRDNSSQAVSFWTLHRLKKLPDKPPHERTPDGAMRNSFPKEVIEKTREVAHEKDQPDISEEDEEEAHNKRQRIRKLARRHVDNHTLANDTNAVKPKRETPRLSELKRALRWLRAQYQRRAEEAARGQDRMIERIRLRGNSLKKESTGRSAAAEDR